MKKVIVFGYFFFLVISNLFCQRIVNEIEDFKSKNIYNYFLKCKKHSIENFTGVDTAYGIINIDSVIGIYKEEKILITLNYNNGKKIKAIGYYDNGQKYRETNFNGTDRDGFDIIWYKNGQKEALMYLRNGKFIIPYLSWYENGNLKKYQDYNFNGTQGAMKEWYISEKLKKEVTFLDSSDKGNITIRYYENGQVLSKAMYNKGKTLYTAYFENGQKWHEGYIYNLEILQLGIWKEWHENGQLKVEYSFKEDEPNIKDGIWSWWDEQGNLIRQEKYNNGKLIDQKVFVKKRTD